MRVTIATAIKPSQITRIAKAARISALHDPPELKSRTWTIADDLPWRRLLERFEESRF
jgi:hypothetical protein